MLGALPLLVLFAAALLRTTTTAFKLPLRMVGDSRPGQQVRSDGVIGSIYFWLRQSRNVCIIAVTSRLFNPPSNKTTTCRRARVARRSRRRAARWAPPRARGKQAFDQNAINTLQIDDDPQSSRRTGPLLSLISHKIKIKTLFNFNSPGAAAAAGGVGTSTGGVPALGSWRQALLQPTPLIMNGNKHKGAGAGRGSGGMAVTANGKRGKVKAALSSVMDEGPMRCV